VPERVVSVEGEDVEAGHGQIYPCL
jgi:hypothetical protein